MAEITVKSSAGKDAGRVELDDAVFGIRPNVAVMHQVVTAQLAHRRAGTHNTKTRSEVRGGGAKPYRQKGTGNARQGSTNSPQYVGGGIALGPKPRSYAQRTPKKMIKLALRSALSDRAADGKVVVVDDWGLDQPRTKDAKAALASLGLDRRVLVVIDTFDSPVALSFRNLPEVQLIKTSELNAYDILCNDWIVFTQSNLPTGETAGATPAETEPAPPEPSTDEDLPKSSTDEAAPPDDDTQEVTASAGDAASVTPGTAEGRQRRGGVRRRGAKRRGGGPPSMKDPRDIILAPVVSEKSYALMEAGVYTFKVHPSASKPEIRDAVQAIWGVEVSKVNTLNRKGKRRRTRGTNRMGSTPATKRAIVTLTAGEIPLFEN